MSWVTGQSQGPGVGWDRKSPGRDGEDEDSGPGCLAEQLKFCRGGGSETQGHTCACAPHALLGPWRLQLTLEHSEMTEVMQAGVRGHGLRPYLPPF